MGKSGSTLCFGVLALGVAVGCGSQEAVVGAAVPPATPLPARVAVATSATPAPPTPVPENLPVITLNTRTVLAQANSRLLGTCRNHVSDHFPNGAAQLDAMRALAPAWGDGKYLYRIGHGITDGRSDYAYMTGYHFEQTWLQKGGYPYDDLREGLAEARRMGADQLHVVNFGTSDEAEAARYVAYLNGAWDGNRQRFPADAAPVTLFEIGNEISWKRVRGHDQYAPNERVYAERALSFARSMRAASSVPIKIGAVASTNSNWYGDGWSGGAATVRNILGVMGDQVDFLVYHGYPSWPLYKQGDLLTIMAQNEWNRRRIEQEIVPAINAIRPGVAIANTEYFNNLYEDPLHARGLFGAMYNADSVILGLNLGMLASVEFCLSHGDMADAGFFYDDDPSRPTPIYHFQRLLAQHWGNQVIKATGSGLPVRHVLGASAELDLPVLAFSAASSGDKRFLLVLNRTNDTDVTCRIEPGGTGTAYTLAGAQGWDSSEVTVTQAPIDLSRHTFARATITIIAM